MAEDKAITGLAKTLARLTVLNEAQFDEQRSQLSEAKKQTKALQKTANSIAQDTDKKVKDLEKKLADAEFDKGKTLLDKVKQAFGFGGLGIDEAITKSGKRIKKGEAGFEAALKGYNDRVRKAAMQYSENYANVSKDLIDSTAGLKAGFADAFNGIGDDFSELFGTTMGTQFKDAGKKLKAAVSIPIKAIVGLGNSVLMGKKMFTNLGLRLKKFGAGLKNMAFGTGLMGKLKLALAVVAIVGLFKVVSTFMKSGFFEGIMVLKHAFMQGMNKLQIAYYSAMGKDGKADAERKNLINREIDEQKRIGKNARELDATSTVGLKADAEFKDVYANQNIMDAVGDMDSQLVKETIAKATGLSMAGLAKIVKGASDSAVEINTELGKGTSVIDMDSRTQGFSQKVDEFAGLQEQYDVRLGFEDEKGNTITAESLAETLGFDVAQVVTYVQENKDLMMGADGKIQKNQNYTIKRKEDGSFAFQGQKSGFDDVKSLLGFDSDVTDDMQNIGAVSTQSALETKMSLLTPEEREEYARDTSPNAVLEQAAFMKTRSNPDFRKAVILKHGFDPGFSKPDKNQQVGGVEIRDMLLLSEDYARQLNMFRVDIEAILNSQKTTKGGINTNIVSQTGGNSVNNIATVHTMVRE